MRRLYLIVTFISYISFVAFLLVFENPAHNSKKETESLVKRIVSSTSISHRKPDALNIHYPGMANTESLDDPNEKMPKETTEAIVNAPGFKLPKVNDPSANIEDLRDIFRKVIDEKAILVSMQKEKTDYWETIVSGVMQNLPVTFLFFVLSWILSRSDAYENTKDCTSNFNIKLLTIKTKWDEPTQTITRNIRVRLGIYNLEKTIETHPKKKSA